MLKVDAKVEVVAASLRLGNAGNAIGKQGVIVAVRPSQGAFYYAVSVSGTVYSPYVAKDLRTA